MPGGLALHEGDPLALYRVGDEDGGPPLGGRGDAEGVPQGGQAVAVYVQHLPAKGGKLGPEGFHVHDVLGGAVQLDAVVIHHGADVVQGELGGGHGGLPDLALLHLPIP